MVAVGAGVLAVASPLGYGLGSAEVGNVVSASVIAATAVAALAVSLWPARSGVDEASGKAVAKDTGRAGAGAGGQANTGVRRRRGAGGAARAERTGDAVARDPGSSANTGIEERD
ncbi:hypothetical protein EDD99_8163 [Streptomyces sp. 846.5]|nr:hypothetical protein EDD99_8163 [Streptomyces sp. 846.5]